MTESYFLPCFEEAHILVYGDLMLDRYWYGDTCRISPEAPVPVVHVQHSDDRPGGAANVALNIVSLGAKSTLFGLVGDDQEAKYLRNALYGKNIDCQFCTVHHHPTVTKLRILGRNQQLIRMDFEKPFINFDDSILMESYQQMLNHAQVVVLSDYAKGTLRSASQLIQLAREREIPVLVDPKTEDFSHYRGATLVTPNLKEFEAVVGRCSSEKAIVDKARALMRSCEIGSILVTLGKEGMTLISGDGEVVHLAAEAHEVYDVTGAGDTVIGVTAAVLAVTHDLTQAVSLANLAAGVVVTKLGAETVTPVELRRLMRQQMDRNNGIFTEAELLQMVHDARSQGESIVMTNGCFDMLHSGHLQYLKETKALGHRLIVAVNDDASVKRLKGNARPIHPLAERMEMLAALKMVDWVVSFSEDTPARLIEAVNPDVLVKAGDYTVNQIAGAESVMNRGGRVIIASFKPGYSTSKLIEKIKDF